MSEKFAPIDVSGVFVDLQQYLGLWSIDESAFASQWSVLRSIDLSEHVRETQRLMQANPNNRPSAVTMSVVSSSGRKLIARDNSLVGAKGDGLAFAQIELRGTMTKQGSSLSSAGSTVLVREKLRAIKNDPQIDGLMLIIESPGGTVAGTQELADDLYSLSQSKPTVTFAEDMMCSAAIYVGSQSRKVFANTSNAIIGSVGTMLGLYDLSGKAKSEGIVPVLIRTGDLKGSGFAGTEFTDDQRAMWQSIIDSSYGSFIAAIQRTRKISAESMNRISRGGVFSAQASIELGLIDGIRSYEEAFAELQAMVPSSKNTQRKGSSMSESENKPVAAVTAQDIENACPGADATFILNQLKAGASVSTAQTAWTHALVATNKSLTEKAAALESALVAAKDEHAKELSAINAKLAESNGQLEAMKKSQGSSRNFKPLPDVPSGSGGSVQGSSGSPTGSAKERWESEKASLMARGMTPAQAIESIHRSNPDLVAEYRAECEASMPRKSR